MGVVGNYQQNKHRYPCKNPWQCGLTIIQLLIKTTRLQYILQTLPTAVMERSSWPQRKWTNPDTIRSSLFFSHFIVFTLKTCFKLTNVFSLLSGCFAATLRHSISHQGPVSWKRNSLFSCSSDHTSGLFPACLRLRKSTGNWTPSSLQLTVRWFHLLSPLSFSA